MKTAVTQMPTPVRFNSLLLALFLLIAFPTIALANTTDVGSAEALQEAKRIPLYLTVNDESPGKTNSQLAYGFFRLADRAPEVKDYDRNDSRSRPFLMGFSFKIGIG